MIGLLLLYFAGKAFYDLAGHHKKHQWGFAILGVLSYYGGLFLGAIIIALVDEIFLESSISEILVSLMAIPVGILFCWGLYKFLDERWSRPKKPFSPEGILDAQLTGNDNQK